MITLIVDNRYVVVKGADRHTRRAIEAITSYKVAGAHFSQAYKQHWWDGREHLMKLSKKLGYIFPTGLLKSVLIELKKRRRMYRLINNKRLQRKLVDYAWNPSLPPMRDYQMQAVHAAKKLERGILKLPTRSGKTRIAARIIYELKSTALFLVPSVLLLEQAQESLRTALQTDVGIIGDSQWFECDVTVATNQTLSIARKGKNPKFKRMVLRYDAVFFDECHHLVSDEWHQTMLAFNAPFKYGLSATAFLDHDAEVERGVIWLAACCGDVIIDVSTTKLIEAGYLMRPTIEIYPVNHPDLSNKRWSKSLQNEALYANEYRNNLISLLAIENSKKLRVLIITNRLNQVKILKNLISNKHPEIPMATLIGDHKTSAKKQTVEKFVKGEVKILISTVFKEGVDVPEVECVINAEGGVDLKNTLQRMRNLTPAAGKTEAKFIDFADMTNPYFAKHSVARLNAYRSEKGFDVILKEER